MSGRLLEIFMNAPSKAGQVESGTAALSVIVPVESIPPLKVDGFNVRELRRRPVSGFTKTYLASVSKAVLARTTVSIAKVTGKVVMGKVTVRVPSGIVTLAGTRAACGWPVVRRT